MLSYSSSPFTPDSLSNESSPSKPNARNNDVFQQPPCVGCVRPFSTHSAAQREAAKYIMLISRGGGLNLGRILVPMELRVSQL